MKYFVTTALLWVLACAFVHAQQAPVTVNVYACCDTPQQALGDFDTLDVLYLKGTRAGFYYSPDKDPLSVLPIWVQKQFDSTLALVDNRLGTVDFFYRQEADGDWLTHTQTGWGGFWITDIDGGVPGHPFLNFMSARTDINNRPLKPVTGDNLFSIRAMKHKGLDTANLNVYHRGAGGVMIAGFVDTAYASGNIGSQLRFSTADNISNQAGITRMSIDRHGNVCVGGGNARARSMMDVRGFTNLGDAAPAIKMKKVTGLVTANAGGATYVPHGLTASKIVGLQALVWEQESNAVSPGTVPGSQYSVGLDQQNIIVYTTPENSSSILAKPFSILITYEQ